MTDCPPQTSATSGRGNPITAVEAAYNESIEWAEGPANVVVKNEESIKVNLDDDSVKRLSKEISKDRKKDTVEAFVEGSVVVDTVCKIPKQDGKITPEEKGRQEEILLAHGVPPRKIAKFHNPNDGKKELRNKSQKVSNDSAKRKKKTPAGSVS